MKMIHRNESRSPRKGVVLLVVLAMLTLFATVAIAFVTLSEKTVVTMAVAKGAQTESRPDPDLLFSYALSQLVYENENPRSALWTHGLVRNMYGSGNAPFSGLGRIRLQTDTEVAVPALPLINGSLDDSTSLPFRPGHPFTRDEFINTQDRASTVVTPLGTTRKLFHEYRYGNLGSPYTYPDHNHSFLGAFTADGVVVERTFVRRPNANVYPKPNAATGDPGLYLNPNPATVALTDPYAFNPSEYVRWWTDTDNYMIDGNNFGLIEQARAAGYAANSPQMVRLLQELRRRRALVMRPRPSIPPTHAIFQGAGPAYAQYLLGLSQTAANLGLTIDGLFHPNFPAPDDQGGDVKNLAPHFVTRVTPNGVTPAYANNDSYWMDLDFPVQTDPTSGRRYKPLFAFFITDLDGCVNMNFHGNSFPLLPNLAPRHASNQGWGPWEVNLSRVLYPSFGAVPGVLPEYPALFDQRQISPVAIELGRMGLNDAYGSGAVATGLLSIPHFYGQVDYSSRDPGVNPTALQVDVTAITNPPTVPLFPTTYRNAFTPELTGHYWLRQNLLGVGDDRFFDASNLEALLRHGDTGSYGLHSDLRRLLPLSFKEPYTAQGGRAARYQVTTHSWDVLRAGLSPYLANQLTAPSQANGYPNPGWFVGNSKLVGQPATGDNLPFDWQTLLGAGLSGEFASSAAPFYRAVNNGYGGVLSRANLNRYLRPYPHLGGFNLNQLPLDNDYIAGTVPVPNGGPTYGPIPGANQLPPQPYPPATPEDITPDNPVRFDRHPAYQEMARAAERDRQTLAMDIYRRLVSVSGVTVPTIPVAGTNDPTFNQSLRPLRMLAQLAVNIVDFIDEDDVATPFCFYLQTDAVGGAVNPAAPPPVLAMYSALDVINPAEPDVDRRVRRYWVYGTEMPRLVLSEVLAEFTAPPANGAMDVKFWVELASTLPAPVLPAIGNNPNPVDLRCESLYVPESSAGAGNGYAPYQLVIAGTNRNSTDGPLAPTANDNYNTTGVWHKDTPTADFRFKTTMNHFQTPMDYVPDNDAGTPPAMDPARVLPGQRIIIGPQNDTDAAQPPDARRSIQADNTGAAQGWNNETVGRCPRNTPFIKAADLMRYTVQYMGAGNPWQFDGQDVPDGPNAPAAGAGEDANANGVTILLRRLANPYLPYQGDPANPAYNPYITIDYISRVVPNNSGTATYTSRGKFQYFASNYTQLVNERPNPDPLPAGTQETYHTLGSANQAETPFASRTPFDWLTHYDRKLTSLGELMHVSAYKPHELTQKFVTDVQMAATSTAIVADPTRSQVLSYETLPANTGVPLPEIRPGMVLRIGGNNPAMGPEYVQVLAVNEAGSPQPNFRAVFTQAHDPATPPLHIISVPHAHRAPWLDESRRLIRALEFLDASIRYQSRVPFRAAVVGAPVPLAPQGVFHELQLSRASFVNANGEPEFVEPTLGSILEIYDATLGQTLTVVVTNITSNDRFQVLAPAVIPSVHELYVVTQSHAGRVPGKINLNAIRSPQVWQALCDHQVCNSFNPPLSATGLPGAAPVGATVAAMTLPVLDLDPATNPAPFNRNFPYGMFNSVPWTVGVGTVLEFRHPVNGPEQVVVTGIVPAGAVIPPAGPGLPATRPFTIQFTNTPLQAHLLAAHRQPYPAGSLVFVDNVSMIYSQLLLSRDGNFATGYVGRPFQGFTRGARNPLFSGQPDISQQTPNGSGIVDSLFRPEVAIAPATPAKTMFEVQAGHPTKRFELISKIMGTTTTRSNCFAVWTTVGFFEVLPDGSLGQEIGRANGRHVRHRMFAIVDRSAIDLFVQGQGPNYTVLGGFGPNYLLGNKTLDPRRVKLMVDRGRQALYPSLPTGDTFIVPRPDPLGLGRQLINLGQNSAGETAAQMGVGVGQRITVLNPAGVSENVTVLAIEPAPNPNMVWVKFANTAAFPNGTLVRVTSALPASVVHASVIE